MKKIVSIPYGTIKSPRGYCFPGLRSPVSIPYGTIKRNSCTSLFSKPFLFQFLMVRLKVP